jgi:hypothetical protein
MVSSIMPLILINMGGEMLYILEQRLKAQNIAADKADKVLHDVCNAMFGSALVAKIFEAGTYTPSTTKALFQQLAHSSIMRLNESSMSKLFDLMTMGFKFQVMTVCQPRDLIQVTLNHLDALRAMVHTSSACVGLVDDVHKNFIEAYGNFSFAAWARVRQKILAFFQDRRVKVSLFLQDGLQSPDGMIVVTHTGAMPIGSETPGTIRTFNPNKQNHFVALPNANDTKAPVVNFDMTSPERPCQLGINLYSTDRKRTGIARPAARTSKRALEPEVAPEPPVINNETQQKAARAELSLLSSLIGASSSGTGNPSLMNLFPEPDVPTGDGKTAGSGVIVLDAADRRTTESLWKQFGNLDFGDDDDADDGEDDLLALMDGAN